MESVYPDPVSKVSLAFSVGKVAKTQLVHDYGVGEELAMNIMGWVGPELRCVAQMDLAWPDYGEEDKASRVSDAVVVMRRGWACDSFTLLAEGYVSRDPAFSKDKDLLEAFVQDTGQRVTECLSIIHVDHVADTLDVCAVPFRIRMRKEIEWGPLLRSDSTDTLRNSAYVAMMMLANEVEPMDAPEDADTFYLALATGLSEEAGFYLQYDL